MADTHVFTFPTRRSLIALGAAALLSSSPLLAADGDLDANFDADGIASVQVSAGFNDSTQDVLTLLDGSVILAGSMQWSATDHDFAVVKLTPYGSLDSSFGSGGQVTVAFDLGGTIADYGMAIARQPDGKLVVAGYAEKDSNGNFDLAVTRMHDNGTPDTSFGSGGKVTVAVDLGGSNFDIANDVLVQPDGKIVLVGWAERAGNDQDFVAVRLLSNGALDNTFGVAGKAVVHFDLGGINRDTAEAAVLQSDGKIVMVGSVELSNYDFDFAAARLDTDGLLDTSFGSGGRVNIGFDRGGADQDFAEAVAIDNQGRLVLAGRSEGPQHVDHDFAVARLLSTGSLDTSFSSDGKVTVGIDVGMGLDQAFGVAMAPSNKIIVAGTAWIGGLNSDLAAVRLNDNGTVDTGFGSNGRSRVAFDIAGSDFGDEQRALAIGIDGGIIMAGPVDTIQDLRLTGVAKLQGESWFSW